METAVAVMIPALVLLLAAVLIFATWEEHDPSGGSAGRTAVETESISENEEESERIAVNPILVIETQAPETENTSE